MLKSKYIAAPSHLLPTSFLTYSLSKYILQSQITTVRQQHGLVHSGTRVVVMVMIPVFHGGVVL
jgi:hypothetical protein